MQRSAVEWAQTSVCSDPVAMAKLHRAVSKLMMRKGIAERNGFTFEMLDAEWGDEIDVRKALFYHTEQGHMYPKYGPDIARWKAIIHDFCQWHEIVKLDQIVALWSDLVDSFMACHEYETQVNPEFRAWSYGCMCKFVLEQRKQARKNCVCVAQYSPEHPEY